MMKRQAERRRDGCKALIQDPLRLVLFFLSVLLWNFVLALRHENVNQLNKHGHLRD